MATDFLHTNPVFITTGLRHHHGEKEGGETGKKNAKSQRVVIMSVFPALLISTIEGALVGEHENIKLGRKNWRVN